MLLSDTQIALILEEAELQQRIGDFQDLRDSLICGTTSDTAMWRLAYDLIDWTMHKIDEVQSEMKARGLET